MGTTSVWRGTTGSQPGPTLTEDLDADVVVVGGGITGVTTAWLLAEEGRSVVLLEAHGIGMGDTGGSTGNLYETVSGGLRGLKSKWDAQALRAVVASRREAVDLIERLAQRVGPQAAFRRCGQYLYAGTPDATEAVEQEAEAAREAGAHARWIDTLPEGPPAAHGRVLVHEHQAQCHPLAYVQGLAALAAARGARLFERSPVLEVDAGKHLVRTAHARVNARDIVLATHSPSGFHLVQAGMLVHREYGLAAAVEKGRFPEGIFWAQGRERLSVRGLDTAAGSFLLCVGEDHTTGQHDAAAAMSALEDRARRKLGLGEIAYRWSAQNFRSPDGLPYIGRDASGACIATGFATDGLVYGTLAATVLADQILGRSNRWSELYKATRFTPVKSARALGEETAVVLKAVVRDYLTQRQREKLSALRAGDAAIVDLEGERVAAYRDAQGQLHAVSPVCTHLKCLVHWNAVETSWDCPCHGSRFAPDGSVLEGPAVEPLERRLPPA